MNTDQKVSDLLDRDMSEAKLRWLIDNLNDMVFIIATDETFTFLNSQVEVVMGYPLDHLLQTSFTRLIHPEDLATSLEVFQSVLAGERVQHYEYRACHAEGHYYWQSANLSPFEENGEIYCLGVASFIHDRKQAEFALKESELRLHLALEASNTGLWDWSIQTNAVIFNANWRGMLGYAKDEIDNLIIVLENISIVRQSN